MSGYNQNCVVIPMGSVAAATAAHSGPYVVKGSEAFQGALVIISGLGAETMALQLSPDGAVFGAPAGQTAVGDGTYYLDLRGAAAYKFVKSAGASTVTVTHSVFRYS